MEMTYHKWLELNINHEYFVVDHPHLSLLPTRKSSLILQQNNILLRQSSGSFEFYIGSESPNIDINSQLENLGTLEFQLLIDDSLFFNYTELTYLETGAYYLFRNLPDSSEIQIEQASAREVAAQLQPDSLGIVQIHVAHLQTDIVTVIFHARSAFQKYKIVIPESRVMEVLEIVVKSQNGELYSGPENSEIMPGQPAIVYTSNEAIRLKDHYGASPTLLVRYRDNSSEIQNMELALPNPSPESLRNSEDGIYFTETIIYV